MLVKYFQDPYIYCQVQKLHLWGKNLGVQIQWETEDFPKSKTYTNHSNYDIWGGGGGGELKMVKLFDL